jgi:hypothetical protein
MIKLTYSVYDPNGEIILGLRKNYKAAINLGQFFKGFDFYVKQKFTDILKPRKIGNLILQYKIDSVVV